MLLSMSGVFVAVGSLPSSLRSSVATSSHFIPKG
jgi:hypothetical protein